MFRRFNTQQRWEGIPSTPPFAKIFLNIPVIDRLCLSCHQEGRFWLSFPIKGGEKDTEERHHRYKKAHGFLLSLEDFPGEIQPVIGYRALLSSINGLQ